MSINLRLVNLMFDRALYDKMLAKVLPMPNGGCWLWTGNYHWKRPYPGNRYGYLGIKQADGKWRTRHAHRAMWAALHGWPSKDRCVCHTCDTPLCVNPAHLYLGTMADNMRDRDERRRNHNLNRTHCKFGHPFDAQNTYIKPDGARSCKTCKSNQVKRRWRTDPEFRARNKANQQRRRRELQGSAPPKDQS